MGNLKYKTTNQTEQNRFIDPENKCIVSRKEKIVCESGVLTSGYKINKPQGCTIQHEEYG